MNWLGKTGKNEANETDIARVKGRFLSEAELKKRTHGFVAIYERRSGRMKLYLRGYASVRDENGRIYPDSTLNWADYGRTWRAYLAQPFAPQYAGKARTSLKA